MGVSGARSILAAPIIASLLFVASVESAQAQLFPWGGWGNSNWQQKPKRQRRPSGHFVEPKNFENKYPIPETSGGPLLLVVSIADQKVTVYDGTNVVITAPISSGMRGHETPTGIFSILEKNRYHYSNLYGGAPMPFMQRITNSGVALHAGNLPGYPASHGCIRLPYSFARNLFGTTEVGARVIVTNHDVKPVEIASPYLIAPLPPGNPEKEASNGGMPAAQQISASKEDFEAVLAAARPDADLTEQTRTREKAAADREQYKAKLNQAIIDAEDGVKAAIANSEAKDQALRDASKAYADARDEHRRLARVADKEAYGAKKAQKSFASLTRKLTDLDAKKLSGEELDKKVELEIEQEEALLKVIKEADAAKAAVKIQAIVVKQASDNVDAAKQARKDAREAIGTAKQAVVLAKKELASATAIDERRDYPVSVFISRKSGRLVAKLGFIEVIDVPVAIKDPETPIGTHVFTATDYTKGETDMRWTVATVRPSTKEMPPRRRRRDDEEFVEHADGLVDPNAALARIEIPEKTRQQLAELMKPRSSIIVTDFGLSRETSERTEFIVEPWRVRGYR